VPGGVTQPRLVRERTTTAVHGMPATVTVVPVAQAVPLAVSVTRVPPVVAPWSGATKNES